MYQQKTAERAGTHLNGTFELTSSQPQYLIRPTLARLVAR